MGNWATAQLKIGGGKKEKKKKKGVEARNCEVRTTKQQLLCDLWTDSLICTIYVFFIDNRIKII